MVILRKKLEQYTNYKHCIAVDLILKHNQKGSMLGRVGYIICSTNVIRLHDVTWRGVMAAYTTKEIPNIHIFNWVY